MTIAENVKKIVKTAQIYIMLPGTYIHIEGGRSHAVLTIFPKKCTEDQQQILSFGYVGSNNQHKSFVKGMNYKQ